MQNPLVSLLRWLNASESRIFSSACEALRASECGVYCGPRPTCYYVVSQAWTALNFLCLRLGRSDLGAPACCQLSRSGPK